MGITLLVTERAPKVFSSSILIRDTLNMVWSQSSKSQNIIYLDKLYVFRAKVWGNQREIRGHILVTVWAKEKSITHRLNPKYSDSPIHYFQSQEGTHDTIRDVMIELTWKLLFELHLFVLQSFYKM